MGISYSLLSSLSPKIMLGFAVPFQWPSIPLFFSLLFSLFLSPRQQWEVNGIAAATRP